MEEKRNVEQLLKDGVTVQFHPQGESMFPLFVRESDYAIVEPAKAPFRRLEVYVFRSFLGPLTIHRLKKITPQGLYFIGDRQQAIEGPIAPEMVYGRMIAYIRKGRKHSVKYLPYRIYAAVWMLLRPCRFFLFKIGHYCKVIVLKIKGGKTK